MKLLVLLALAGLAYGQLGGPGNIMNLIQGMRDRFNRNDDVIDYIHFWRLEDHTNEDGDHYLLFINDRPGSEYCMVIMVNQRWEDLLEDEQTAFLITEEIYELVNDPSHRERAIEPEALRDRFNDFDAFRECRDHHTAILRYTPSQAVISQG